MNSDRSRIERQPPKILVGTPGRLIDLLESSQLRQSLKGLQTLVLDEADRLLDMGFKYAYLSSAIFVHLSHQKDTLMQPTSCQNNFRLFGPHSLPDGWTDVGWEVGILAGNGDVIKRLNCRRRWLCIVASLTESLVS